MIPSGVGCCHDEPQLCSGWLLTGFQISRNGAAAQSLPLSSFLPWCHTCCSAPCMRGGGLGWELHPPALGAVGKSVLTSWFCPLSDVGLYAISQIYLWEPLWVPPACGFGGMESFTAASCGFPSEAAVSAGSWPCAEEHLFWRSFGTGAGLHYAMGLREAAGQLRLRAAFSGADSQGERAFSLQTANKQCSQTEAGSTGRCVNTSCCTDALLRHSTHPAPRRACRDRAACWARKQSCKQTLL